MERVMGIEPTSKAWEAFILPLNYTRGEPSFYGCCSALATRFTTFAKIAYTAVIALRVTLKT
jgi:hypothetical protein